MRRSSIALIVNLVAVVACTAKGSKNEPAPQGSSAAASGAAAAPAPGPATAPGPGSAAPGASTSHDRTADPAFALKEENGKYIGRVADKCPWEGEADPRKAIPRLADSDYKLVDSRLEIELPYGGCPQWTGYTVVTGSGSPLPFYVCHELQHDTCEMAGRKTWVFDVSAQLKANNATAVQFVVPAGVH